MSKDSSSKNNNRSFRYSDLITTVRIIFVAIFAILVSYYPTLFGLIPGSILIFLIFNSDSLDGIVARRYDPESKYGAFYDIAGDRITEIVLLVPFVFLQTLTPILVVYFVAKGFMIDYHRFVKYDKSRDVPFKQTQTKLQKMLVSSRFMRGFYGVVKYLLVAVLYIGIFEPGLVNIWVLTLPWVVLVVSLMRTVPNYLPSR